MIEWSGITGFEWDHGNVEKSRKKHDVSCREAEEMFCGKALLVMEDRKHGGGERRFHALGCTLAGRKLLAAFTTRGNLLRVISVRPMNRKEKRIYESKAG